MNRANVYISCCSRRNPEWDMYTSLQNAMEFARGARIDSTLFPRVGGTLICRERNRVARDFLIDGQHTHLLTIDDDVTLPKDAIVKLVSSGKSVIGGIYRLKDMSGGRVAVRIPSPQLWPMILKGGIISEATYLSSGCMMVTNSFLEAMVRHYPDTAYNENLSHTPTWALYQPYIHVRKSGLREYLSEDWAFCQRVRDMNTQLYVHGGVKCGHWGLMKYDFYYPERFIDACGDIHDSEKNSGMFSSAEVDMETLEEGTI